MQFGKWDEAKHPRKGGKFAPKGTGDSGEKETKAAGKEAPKASSSAQSSASSGGEQISATTQNALAAKGFTKTAGDQAQKTFDRIKDNSTEAKAVTKEKEGGFSIPLQLVARSIVAQAAGAAVGVGAFALIQSVAPGLPSGLKLGVAAGLSSLARDGAYNKLMDSPAGKALKESGIRTEVSGGRMILNARENMIV